MKTRAALNIIFVSIIMLVMSGCDFINTNPKLSIPLNAESKIDQIVNTLYENDQFSGAVLVSVNDK